MSDMKVEQELKGFVQAVADVSPEPPLLDSQAQRVQRRLAPVVALAAGFAAALVLVGGGAVWMFADDADSPPTGSSDPSELGVPPTKQEILADGVVTEAEYRAAVDAVVGCMDAEGIDTSVRYDSSGIAAFDSQGTAAAEKFDACFSEHLGSVAYVWADQNASPESEIAFYNDVVDCVEAQTGESYGDVEAVGDTKATDAAIGAAPDVYGACLDRMIEAERLQLDITDTSPQNPGIDAIFLRNVSTQPIDVSGWTVTSRGIATGLVVPENTVIEAGQSIAVYEIYDTLGAACPDDTSRAFFTCNTLGQATVTGDLLFPVPIISVLDRDGAVVVESHD